MFGKGHLGGGLADLWERAGHLVTRLGRDGGDVSDAEVVLIAVPGGEIAGDVGVACNEFLTIGALAGFDGGHIFVNGLDQAWIVFLLAHLVPPSVRRMLARARTHNFCTLFSLRFIRAATSEKLSASRCRRMMTSR